MELRHLATFVAVAEEANFTRGAQRISIAQPAVSQQVRRLEAELGEVLFVRDRRGARLTPAGATLLPHARATLAAAEGARQAMVELRGLLSGRLSIGTVQAIPDHRLARLLGEFRRRHPQVELGVVEAETDDLLASLIAGSFDLALIGTGPYHEPPAEVEALPFAQEPVVAVVPAEHRLARRARMPLHALRDEPIVTLTTRSRMRSTLIAACRQAGFSPRIVAETTDLGLLVDLVNEGIGVAVMPASGLRTDARVVPIPITRPELIRRLLFVWRRSDISPTARAFLSLVRERL